MRKALLITVVAALPLLAAAGYATANDQSDLELRQATVAYHDIAVAKAEFPDAIELPPGPPYGEGTCIANLEGAGAMGIHLLIPNRVDENLVLTEPEALLYEAPRRDLQADRRRVRRRRRDAAVAVRTEFAPTNLARYGNPAATVWTLHAWVWKGTQPGHSSPGTRPSAAAELRTPGGTRGRPTGRPRALSGHRKV